MARRYPSRCTITPSNFFAGAPGEVRVAAGDREYMYSLTLPELSDSKWKPPASAMKGIPAFAPAVAAARDVWPVMAFAGALCLLAEWMLYGRFRRSRKLVLLARRLFGEGRLSLRKGEAADEFRTSLGALSVALAARLGGVGMAQPPAVASAG